MVRGVSIEAVAIQGRPARPVALVAEDRTPHYSQAGLGTIAMLDSLCNLSDSGGDLVTFSVDYFSALLLHEIRFDDLLSIWRGDRTDIGRYQISYVPSLYLWVYRPDDRKSVKITDIKRWGSDTLTETAAMFGVADHAPVNRWTLTTPGDALSLAERCASVYGQIARGIVAAFDRAGLPKYWRDGTGRVAGALMDRMARRSDVKLYPGAISHPIQTGYFGGRVNISTVGNLGDVTQLDIRSAYPAVMAKLPSLDGAKWRRVRSYDASIPWALWHVSWGVSRGARLGPFPLRRNGAVTYPLNGSGWYWASEVAAAIAVFGAESIRPDHGVYIDPASDRKPFAGISDLYKTRAALRDSGDAAAAHVLKLALTSCYGRLAQEKKADGSRGRWANLALAGLVTSETRAIMLRLYADHWNEAAAIATDSLTVRGTLTLPSSRDLGGLSVDHGSDAILLPSGAYHATKGAATMDRVSGVDRNRSRLIDWDRVRRDWGVVGLALNYHLSIPFFVGIGLAAVGGQSNYCRWKMVRRDIVGGASWDTSERIDWRTWHVYPDIGDGLASEMYVPRAGVQSRMMDQSLIDTVEAITENGTPH